MLDFTKVGICLGIWPFTKKVPAFTQIWEFMIFSCEMEKNLNDVQYVLHQLESRYNPGGVERSEKKRRARRAKENKSKLKRKKQLAQKRHEDVVVTSDSSDDVVDIIDLYE